VEKNRLNLIVASAILVTSVLLIWALRMGDSIGTLLTGIVIALFIWVLLEGKKPAKLTEFLVKSFFVSFIITSIVWFVSLGSLSLVYSAFWGTWLVQIIFPRSLLPVAISVIIYGIFRVRLRSWEILLSSWYVFIFAVQAAYNMWWTLFVKPYITHYYSSGAGAIALDMLLVFVAFLIACIFSIVYIALKGPKEEPPP